MFVTDRKSFLAGASFMAIAMFIVFLLFTVFNYGSAKAQDANGKYGTRYGCLNLTVGAAWTGTAITGLKDQTNGSPIPAGMTSWSTVWVKNSHATNTVYICLNTATSCPASTANMQAVAPGAAIELSTVGTVTASGTPFANVSLQGSGAGTTATLCGFVK